MTRQTAPDPVLAVGQVWEDCDPRQHPCNPRRRLRIVEVMPNGAVVENIATKRRSGILLRRFRPTSTGYRLLVSPLLAVEGV